MIKTLTGFLLVLSLAGLYLYLQQTGAFAVLFNQQTLQHIVNDYGQWGPFLIIILMCIAIVMSPLPSAPIALVSGAAFGHIWGTVYILIGSLLGAVIAFSLARMLGYEAMQKRFGDSIKIKWLQSENQLMLVVGVSRLIPFISFDIVSYAAGLTSLGYIKFTVATLLGIIPASFLLAHFGNELVTSDLPNMVVTVLLLGGITAIPIIIGVLVNKYRRG